MFSVMCWFFCHLVKETVMSLTFFFSSLKLDDLSAWLALCFIILINLKKAEATIYLYSKTCQITLV